MTTYANAAELLSAIQPAEGGRDVFDPATGELVGRAPVAELSELDDIVARATAAQVSWAALPEDERKAYLDKAADAIDANAEALAELLSREQGKPLNGPNARFEVGACANWLRATASFDLKPEVLLDDETGYSELRYVPLGVVAAINPWNWPMMIAIWQFAPSLRMGNTVVTKPASSTTLSVAALVHVMNEVLPADVLILLPGNSKVGSALTKHEGIAKIMFTGSTPVGRTIAADAASTVKRLTLELGGNDAGIVLPDADPQAIAGDLFWGAFINTGQTCAALKRLYVHEDIYDAVCEALIEVAKNSPMGNGLDENNVLGPLQNKGQYETVKELVDKAKASGARVLLGGEANDDQPGYFFPTTLVADISNENELVQQEQFGPALPIIKYSTVEQAIEWANDSEYGLGSSVWSSNREKALEVAAKLQAGSTWINKHGAIDPRVPFGGAKQSGYGLEFGIEGLKHVSQPKVVSI
ncbi:aldehyde dehydrogenase [Pseudoclavibacter endophyticus]|uniref:Aldehyde dehydrogenase family protein n=1 Tax=Pseudoclavibacter endophyticus TaxID=1778590 RepID=A0A6H9WMY8_9MICO|nr:aldehyde dehydrogenase family protein [Pseudoclavibacter endophyticus]KAB1649438.1 aldehyde dehydrogenase family protein [Pseudoclavibacter endophyticus]GGA62655.1 aldehyde dehydrogenase [Pseudoclavibacter endophyticus]